MKNKKAGKIIRTIIFCIIALVLITVTALLAIPSWKDSYWQPAESINGFYDTPKDTMDILFYGSSAMEAAMDPYQLYKEHGFASYNMALQSQTMFSTYIWLEETLRFQKPKLAVLDVKALAHTSVMRESMMRRSYEYLRLGKPKLEFALTHCSVNEDADLVDYLLPIRLYHSRWSELNRNDFDLLSGKNSNYSNGFTMLGTVEEGLTLPGLTGSGDPSGEGFNDDEEVYLKKFVDLCRENKIDLILIRTVDEDWSEDMHAYAARLAKENEVPFLDFNMKDLLEATKFRADADLQEDIHANIRGAEKLTTYMGNYIADNYQLPDHREMDSVPHRIFTEGEEMYQAAMADKKLTLAEDLSDWLKVIRDAGCYTVYAVTPKTKEKISEEAVQLLQEAGFPKEFAAQMKEREKVLSIAVSGEEPRYLLPKVDEETQEEATKVSLREMPDGNAVVSIRVEKANASVTVDNEALIEAGELISFTAYNLRTGKVADVIQLETDENDHLVLQR